MRKHYFKLALGMCCLALSANTAFAFHRHRDQAPLTTTRTYVPQMPQTLSADQSTSAPFDGGISILVAAGIGYASKKGYDKRKKQKEAHNQ